LLERGEIPHVSKSTDTIGREQPRQRKPVSIFNPTPKEEKAVQNPAIVEKMEAEVPLSSAMSPGAHVAHNNFDPPIYNT